MAWRAQAGDGKVAHGGGLQGLAQALLHCRLPGSYLPAGPARQNLPLQHGDQCRAVDAVRTARRQLHMARQLQAQAGGGGQ